MRKLNTGLSNNWTSELVFLNLQNNSSLVDLNFCSVSNLSSLRVLRLYGCTKLEKTPDFTRASNLEYLDMDVQVYHLRLGSHKQCN